MDPPPLTVRNIVEGQKYRFSVCQVDDCDGPGRHKTGTLIQRLNGCMLEIQWNNGDIEQLNYNRIKKIIKKVSGGNKSKNHKKSKKNKKNKRITKRYRK